MDAAAKRLRQLDAAGSGPVLILLQSNDRSSPIATLLAPSFRVIRYAVNEPGSGSQAALTGELVDAIGQAGGPAGVVADAANAPAALDLAARRPDLMRALALLAPPVPETVLSDLKTPLIALFGTRNFPPQIGRKLRTAIANCHVMFIYDTSDDMANQRPEAVAAALREFLTAGDRFIVTGKSGKLYP